MGKIPTVLITGISSIHGYPIYQHFKQTSAYHVVGVRGLYSFFPIVDPEVYVIEMLDFSALEGLLHCVKPDVILHCFGMCDLDAAERTPHRAYRLNVEVMENLVRLVPDTPIIYTSYDLVFSGMHTPTKGYRVADIPDPISVVGTTIWETEQCVLQYLQNLVVRLGLPIGPSVQGTKGAYDYIAQRIRKGLWMTLFTDEIRSVPRTCDLGPAIEGLLQMECKGIWHLGSVRSMSLYEIGLKIAHDLDITTHSLDPMLTRDAPSIPPRIQDVRLDSTLTFKTLGYSIEGWGKK
jgi:dTDP-4-dehydrorhamnose reductase